MSNLSETYDIGEILQSILADSNKVQAQLGDGAIRPDVLEFDERLPAIRYEVLTTDEASNLSAAAGFAISRVQFDCYAKTRRQANKVGETVRDVLNGYIGTVESIRIWDCFIDNQYNRTDRPSPGETSWRYIRVLDFEVSHSLPIPTLVA